MSFAHILKTKFSELLFETALNQNEDVLALQYLAPLTKLYLPWSKSAMRPSGIVKVLNEIIVNKRACIVEFGGGISTYYIAQILKSRGGHLYTIEHDPLWAKQITELLDTEKLQKLVTVVNAPLKECNISLDTSYWYDEKIIENTLSKNMIDLIVVDGPPAYKIGQELSRYPALPKIKKYLKDNFCIIIDDVGRNGEKKIIKIWEKELSIIFEKHFIDGSVAIGRSGTFFTV